MQISGLPPKPRRRESIVPMINVVFLLLIFFLMTAQIVPPDPFDVLLPTADQTETAEGASALYLSSDGVIGFRDLEGDLAVEAAFQDLAERGETRMELRADAGVEGRTLAGLLRQLAEQGVAEVALVTAAP